MGLTYLPVEKLPEPGTVVWCKYPKRKDIDRPAARPVLVRGTSLHEDENGIPYGAVKVTYGTGETQWCDDRDFIISDEAEWRPLGLHKPTCFQLDAAHTKTFVWSPKYFAAPDYFRDTPITIGRLTLELEARFKKCVARRAFGA